MVSSWTYWRGPAGTRSVADPGKKRKQSCNLTYSGTRNLPYQGNVRQQLHRLNSALCTSILNSCSELTGFLKTVYLKKTLFEAENIAKLIFDSITLVCDKYETAGKSGMVFWAC